MKHNLIISGLSSIVSIFAIIFLFLFFVLGPIVTCEIVAKGVVFVKTLTLENPSFDELQTFVSNDQTDSNIYSDAYNCEDFSDDVILNARAQGYKAGYVFMKDYTYADTEYGHAIVCFNTDKGLYFLEPQLDVLFSEAEMDNMLDTCLYDITLPSGEYFSEHFIEYQIDWFRFILD